jgi:PAS domain S-box-containing protein
MDTGASKSAIPKSVIQIKHDRCGGPNLVQIILIKQCYLWQSMAAMEKTESPNWPVGGGNMGALIRTHDWSTTSLGSIETWSPSLKAATDILLRLPASAVLLWGIDGIVLYNDAYIAFAGAQHPQLLGSAVREPSSTTDNLSADLLRISMGGDSRVSQARECTLLQDGREERVWRNVDYSPVVDEAGKPNGVLVIFLESAGDAAERIKLLEAEGHATRTLNSITDAFLVLDADERFIYVNPAARAMLAEQGIKADDVIGKQYLTEVFEEARDDQSGRGFRRAMRERVPVAVENFYAPFNRWYAIRFFPIEEGGLSMVFQDITERKRADDALRESEAKFRALAEASPALIAMLDPDANVVYMNQRHEELFGEGWTEIMGTGWHAVIHPDDAAACIAAIEQAVRERARIEQRVRVKSRDNEWRWVEAYALPWFSAGGQYAGHVFVSLDITQAVRAEEALKEADRRKDEFLATLAHELRNPLAPICSLMPLIGRPGGARAADRLQEVLQRQVRQLVRLVDDLMDGLRVTKGKIDLRKAHVQLADVIRSAIEESQPLIDSAGHQLTVSVPETALTLDADPARLTQVFANLINNAVRYTEKGGHIWVTACRDRNNAVVSVRDNGIGITPEMLPRVFEMFAQEVHSSGRSQGGLGIGLTLVDNLVRMHGGSVEAKSEGHGRGSEFIVRLPLAQQARIDQAAEAGGSSLALATHRVLVVDDNPDAADSLAMLLESLGAAAHVVNNGAAALAALDAFRPDVVLLDIGMPGMDGYEVAQRIRQQPQFNAVKLIAVTGWGLEADRRSSRASGFDHHLTKPIDIAALQALLSTP